MPKKILHIISNLGLGGAQVVLKQIVENSDNSEFTHFIYPLRNRKKEVKIEGKIIRNNFPDYDLRKFFEIIKICRKNQIDIIHAHLSKPIMLSLLASFFVKASVLVHEHSPIYENNKSFFIYRTFLRLFRHKAAKFIAVSNKLRHYYREKLNINEEKICVTHNAIDLSCFNPAGYSAPDVRKQLGFGDEDIVIGFSGRLNTIKGVDILVRAMPLLVEKNAHFKLLLIGDGPLRDELEKYVYANNIGKNVKFFGFCDNVPRMLSAIDIGAVPSRKETFGISCLEMMAMGVPVVASGVDGMADFLVDGENCLIAPNDPAALAQKILSLAADNCLKEKLQENALKTANKFNLQNFITKIEDLYTDRS